MSSQGFIFIVIAALMNVSSNLMLRAGITRAGGFAITLATIGEDLIDLSRQPLVIAGVFFYALAALLWFQVISTENLNTSYPVLIGLTFTFVTSELRFFSRTHDLAKVSRSGGSFYWYISHIRSSDRSFRIPHGCI
jgi:hypothetical protein